MTAIYLLIGVAALVIFICIILANTVVARKNQVQNAAGGLDALLKKRFDLVPNLVAAVKKYMKHERETLAAITELRARVTGGGLPEKERVDLSPRLGKLLSGLMVAVENYPALKANRNFLQLQAALNETEEQISAARRAYNAAVTDYNNVLEMFPTNVFGALLRYKPKPVYAAEENEKANINVGKLFGA
jgi:LemA protein